MALPSSGTITLNQIHTEVGGGSGTTASLNDSDLRALASVPSGQISFSNFYGKRYCTVAEWNAYCTSITSTTISGSSYSAITGWIRVTNLAASGTMWGTPRDSNVHGVTSDSALNRVVQHMVGSSTEFSWLVSNGVQALIYQRNYGSYGTHTAATYNGYTSLSYGTFDTNDLYQCEWLYDGVVYNRTTSGSPTVLAVG